MNDAEPPISSHVPSEEPGIPPSVPERRRPALDFTMVLLLVAAAMFTLIYRSLAAAHLDRTIAMFVGVPMFLGMFAATTTPKGAVGAAMKYVTLCLCIVAPLLGEGAVCLAMSVPIVYPIAALVAWLVPRIGGGGKVRAVALLPFIAAMVDRSPPSTLDVVEVRDTADVDAPVGVVWSAVDRLTLPLGPPPLFLRAGFPTPIELVGEGLAPGSERRLVFDNGTVVCRVTSVDPGKRVTMTLSYADVGDEFFDRWLLLEDSSFDFEPLAGGGTRITHTTHYRRLLAPAFYFGPLEEYGVHRMQGYLLGAFAERFARRGARGAAAR